MKVKIEIQETLEEDEVVIRCSSLNEAVISLQNFISEQNGTSRCLKLTDKETDYFFDTEGRELRAHTADRIFSCGYKLYELEELLSGNFLRISKSTIVNLDHIYSITRNLTASSLVEFNGSSKKTLVSRGYYRLLTERLRDRKLKGAAGMAGKQESGRQRDLKEQDNAGNSKG